MSGRFEGFTQEDINKLSRGGSGKNPKPAFLNGRGIRRMPDKETSKAQQKAPVVQVEKTSQKHEALEGTTTTTGTDESMTSLQEAIYFRPLSYRKQPKPEVPDESILHLSDIQKHEENEDDHRNTSSPFRGISLKDFEVHRKRIEEQNKQKKEILYRAIEHHSQKTAAEAKKIEEIKAELAKLDNDLAVDVAILRKQIEAACLQYYNIQKQYHKIESQFLKAKMDLHNASERKELLTEHLCTVITHNEDRKAKKLSELMEKVGISPSGDLDIEEN